MQIIETMDSKNKSKVRCVQSGKINEISLKKHLKIIEIFTHNLNSAFLCKRYLLILHEVDWKCILNLLKRAKLYLDIYQTNYTMVHAHIWSVYEQPFSDIFQIFLHLARTHLFSSNNFHDLQFLLDCPNLITVS